MTRSKTIITIHQAPPWASSDPVAPASLLSILGGGITIPCHRRLNGDSENQRLQVPHLLSSRAGVCHRCPYLHGVSPTMHWASPCLGDSPRSEMKPAAPLCAQGHVRAHTHCFDPDYHAPFLDTGSATALCLASMTWGAPGISSETPVCHLSCPECAALSLFHPHNLPRIIGSAEKFLPVEMSEVQK